MARVKPLALAWVTVVVLVVAGCAAGANDASVPAAGAGFWFGLWHGLISPVTFVISLFDQGVSLYEVHNTGGWYDFGFILGVSVTFGALGHGGGRSTRGTSRHRRRQ